VSNDQSASADGYRLGNRARKALYVAGTILFALSLAFVATFAVRNWHAIGELDRVDAMALIATGCIYGAAHASSSAAWVLGLRRMGQDIPLWPGIRINLITQVGKYLPGNVAHYLARAGLASASGVKLSRSGTATLLEILATLFTAALVASVAMLFDSAPVRALDQTLSGNILVPLLPAGIGIATAAGFLRYARVPIGAFIAASVCVIITFILIGLSFFTLVSAISAQPLSPIAAIGIFAVAWTAGYVVPGAPAGLGVREAILVAWVSPIIGGAAAVACVILHRVISACVDALVALIGYGWLRFEKVAR
jgi:uncharacterized membrane protein YbhN (UPF0104 family)